MYAIIKSGSRQYKVEAGEEILVDSLGGNPGEKLSFAPLLVSGNGNTEISGSTKVEAVIVGAEKGKKVIAFKYRPKKHSKTTKGHRSHLTRIRIEAIGSEKAPAAGTAKTAKAPSATAAKTAKAASAKTGTATKTASAKTATAKAATAKTAASKTTAAKAVSEKEAAPKKAPAAKKEPKATSDEPAE